MRHTQRREWQAEWKIGEARQAGEGGNGGFSSCGYSKHSVHSKRVTYWTGCLFLCLSVSFKQLCAMLNRNPALLRLLLVSSFFLVWSPFFLTSLHLPSCHLLSPPLLLVVISSLSPGSEYCTPWPPPPPSPSLFLSPSLLLLPCFPIFHSLSLSLPARRENSINGGATVTAHATGCRQHLLLHHLPLWLSLPARGKTQRRERRAQEWSRAGEDLLRNRSEEEREKSDINRETGVRHLPSLKT